MNTKYCNLHWFNLELFSSVSTADSALEKIIKASVGLRFLQCFQRLSSVLYLYSS